MLPISHPITQIRHIFWNVFNVITLQCHHNILSIAFFCLLQQNAKYFAFYIVRKLRFRVPSVQNKHTNTYVFDWGILTIITTTILRDDVVTCCSSDHKAQNCRSEAQPQDRTIFGERNRNRGSPLCSLLLPSNPLAHRIPETIYLYIELKSN